MDQGWGGGGMWWRLLPQAHRDTLWTVTDLAEGKSQDEEASMEGGMDQELM